MDTESSQNWPATETRALLPARRRRWPVALFLILVFALAGVAGSYAWLNLGLIQSVGREATDADAGTNDNAVLTDLLAAQQKTTDDLATIERAIADQQEQLKAIVSLLASLSSKIEAMKGPASEVPATSTALPSLGPPIATPAPAAAHVSPPAETRAAKQKKPPAAANPSGRISVGGAPLNTTSETTTR